MYGKTKSQVLRRIKTGLLIFVLLFGATEISHSKTLLVTHPELEWDAKATTAPTLRTLLSRTDFKRKIVLTSGSPLNLSTKGLQFEKMYSGQGEFTLWKAGFSKMEAMDNEYVIAGGFFDACSSVSVINILQMVTVQNLHLYFAEEGLFTFPLSLGASSDVMTLKKARSLISKAAYQQYLLNYTKRVFSRVNQPGLAKDILNNNQLHEARASSEMKISVQVDGTEIGSIGHGPQKITFHFGQSLASIKPAGH